MPDLMMCLHILGRSIPLDTFCSLIADLLFNCPLSYVNTYSRILHAVVFHHSQVRGIVKVHRRTKGDTIILNEKTSIRPIEYCNDTEPVPSSP